MAELIQAILLAMIQGVTEFMPISSSGHLVLGQYFFSMNQERFGLPFDMLLNLGTLLAVVYFYRMEVWAMVVAFLRSLPHPQLSDPTERLAYLLLLATIPAATVGFLLQGLLESELRSAWVVAVGFAISGVLFFLAENVGKKRNSTASMSFSIAAIIGLGQVASLIYGISRSGSTLAFGLLVGLERTEAAKFSFLMSIPIIMGAIIIELPEVLSARLSGEALPFFTVGLLISTVTAYFTIKGLLAFFTRHTLKPFAYYCLFAAVAVGGLLWAGI